MKISRLDWISLCTGMARIVDTRPVKPLGDWISTKENLPADDGWFLVVIEGHGKRYQKVDFWNGDDMQWKSTYEDDATHVTHYQKLREMPQIGGNAEYS